jgi:hypothetical protein
MHITEKRPHEITRFPITKDTKPGNHVYRIYNTNNSSWFFGNCEICKKHTDTVFHQVEGLLFIDAETGCLSITYHECRQLFGHHDCLTMARLP